MDYSTICPECKNELHVERNSLVENDVVECDYCGMTLEVTAVDPQGSFETLVVEEEK
ncbi:MAG: hypothetical protein AB1352_01670 [Patescibacteria group bacterium]